MNACPTLALEDFGADALNISVDFWVEVRPGIDPRLVASELRHQIAEALDAAGIVIAFPQRDVHLDTARPLPVQLVPKATRKAAELSAAPPAAQPRRP